MKNVCLKCGKSIEPLEPDDDDMVDNAMVDHIYAPYGSRHDGTIFQIGLCDDCTDILLKEGRINKVGNYLESDPNEQN